MKKLQILALLLIISGLGASAQTTDAVIEKKIETLLKKMTLKEKIGQMNQLSADDMETNYKVIKKGMAGSVLSITNPEIANKAQKIALEQTRLGIPLIIGRDVIHGFKTIFPIPLAQAASFNPDLAEKAARIAAIEASETGIRWTFAPMIDIARDPRWGRIAESCGEDPYLTSVMGAAMVRGFQGKDLSDPTSIAACAKHFAGYGAAEGGRDYNTTNITERQFRNLYLKSFEEAVKKADLATIMTAFNANDGIPSSGNEFLLKQVLRNQWNFKGFVVSDWASITEMVDHGFCSDTKEAAQKAINAGVDMEMVSGTYVAYAESLLKEKKISMESINNSVRNILRIKFKLGLFENPYVKGNLNEVFYKKEHLEIAEKAAEESIVLLKNENNILPLKKPKTIAVFGPLADAPHDQLGTWVFDGDKSHTITPLKALKEKYGEEIKILYEPILKYSRDIDSTQFGKAREMAKQADVVLLFLGEESILSGEAHSLSNLNLQGNQSKLLEILNETKKPIVTVFVAGRPLTIEKEVKESNAVLYAWHPGTMGGPAMVNLLFGKANPSGKLPITFPKNVGQIPMYYNHLNTGRPANGNEINLDNIPVEASQTSLGNKSYYLDNGTEPLFPFGFGLSYTQFEYGKISLSKTLLNPKETLEISFTLKNNGKYKGTEVVQLYVRDISASIALPVKELKGFKRIELESGESKKITFELKMEDLAFYGIDMKKKVEPGKFDLWIGGCSSKGEKVSFEVQ
ncbi:beta-glucosidase BglX [Flavobacterium sp. DG2-3]|uniref:beta-glucosidase BglX n=1 Tax=Flavobacterium sp. DG2-3 TaxID=3068317 RepID=UPI00273E99B3|nr:beta-glucosidase BglX [Flavobacterium sp. DG2-3]MDP5200359.1 beta-glucosidase BglX [Flavobacterium sp. DG2-3]